MPVGGQKVISNFNQETEKNYLNLYSFVVEKRVAAYMTLYIKNSLEFFYQTNFFFNLVQ